MSTFWIVIIASVIVVLFFVVGLSLTQIIKKHPLQSDIATNPEMQRRGIRCALQEQHQQESGTDCNDNPLCEGNCTSCNEKK
ncbi:MAG: hypothetical protein SOZ00_07960 [Tidjanibacter sp.]|nr:hypothetical protein [Tidjanibacter sp.]